MEIGGLYRVSNNYYRLDWRPGELMLCTGVTRNACNKLEYTVLRAVGLQKFVHSTAIGFLRMVA